MGIYNLSEGFTISFDVISHNGGGTFSLYVDNNTTGQDNSVHGAASKFVSIGLADGTMVPGTRFTIPMNRVTILVAAILAHLTLKFSIAR